MFLVYRLDRTKAVLTQISKPVLTFICLKYVHCVANLQRQLLLSSGIVVIDCWRKTREDRIRGGILEEEEKGNKMFSSLVALIVHNVRWRHGTFTKCPPTLSDTMIVGPGTMIAVISTHFYRPLKRNQ